MPWTLLAFASNRGIGLVATLVLTRLLTPKDFGIVALGLLVAGALAQFRDLGLGGALVLNQDLDKRQQGTVLTLMMVTGALLAVVVTATAPLVADLFREPQLDGVLAALSLTIFFGGFSWFYEAVLQRELDFRARFTSLLIQGVAYAAVSLSLAAAGAGFWSLVGGQVAATAAYLAAVVALAPYWVRPAFDRATARSVLGTGRGFMLQGGMAFLQQNADYFAVGRVLGAAQLGYYSLSYRLAELPYVGVADPVARVTFPAFARMRGRGEDIRPAFLSTLRLVALVACPLGVLLSGAADPFVRALLGERWLPMIGPLTVLGLWAAVRPVQTTVAWLLNSVGEAGLMGTLSVVVLVPLVPGLFLAAHVGGTTAVAWVMVADMVFSLALLGWFASRRGGVSLGRQWRALAPVVVACPLAWAATRGAAEATSGIGALSSLALSGASGGIAYLLVVWLVDRGALRGAVGQMRRTLGQAPAA